ncbi:StaA [Primorskyibacter aestuariivivens]|nr:StaA [Primorskyibacter aestuariivivens]MDA7429079.1 StaA [Primorskyibacter aestuariivivens]
MTVEAKPHDAWFRSKVEEALKDPRDTTPHSKVMHQVQTLIDEKRREKS